MTDLDRTRRGPKAPRQWAAYGLTVLGLLLPLLVQAATPGGKGKVSAAPWCVPTGNSTISRICGTSTLHYDYSTMMGEPITHYGLRWALSSMTVHTGAAEAPSTGEEIHVNHPEFQAIFKGSEKRIELMAHGFGELRSGLDDRTWAIEFDSGAPTVAGSMSWHIADAPGWDKLIFYTTDCYPFDNNKRTFISKDNALAIWRAGGLRLVNFQACKNGTLGMHIAGLDAAGAAVARYCKSHPGKTTRLTCPTSPKSTESESPDFLDGGQARQNAPANPKRGAPANWLDEAADAPLIDRIHRDQVAAYRARAEQACAEEMRQIESCISRACGETGLPPGVTAAQCENTPAAPMKGYRGLSMCSSSLTMEECRAASEARSRRDDEEHSKRFNAWYREHGTRFEQCKPYMAKRSSMQSCRSTQSLSCNPDRRDVSVCVNDKMRQAPGKDDARRSYEKDVNTRTQNSGKSSSFLD